MTHATIQRVTEDIEQFKFNTIIAALMEFNNYLVKAKETAVYGTPAWDEAVDSLLLMLAPETPHIAEELWQRRHHAKANGFAAAASVHVQSWPVFDPELAKADTITLVVQVNGKVRDKIEAPAGITEEAARGTGAGQPGRPEVAGGQIGAQGDLRRRQADQHRRWVDDEREDERRVTHRYPVTRFSSTRYLTITRHHQEAIIMKRCNRHTRRPCRPRPVQPGDSRRRLRLLLRPDRPRSGHRHPARRRGGPDRAGAG